MNLSLRLLFTFIAALPSRAALPEAPVREEGVALVADGFAKLNARYWSPTLGIWFARPGDDLRAHFEGRLNPTWWPSANAVETLADAAKLTGEKSYRETAETVYALNRDYRDRTGRLVEELRRRQQWSEADEAKQKGRDEKRAASESVYYTEFRNEYLDDSGWWGLAWLKLADLTHEEKYLTTARAIHAHMAKNWREDKGGGVIWCEDADKQKPNAITNQLFAILSARLFVRTHEPAYLEWAERTLEWTRASKLYDGTAIVDAPGHHGDYWGTNQGTYLGMLTALFQATKRTAFLDEAAAFTDTALARAGLVTADGVLVEKLGTKGDASLFKGVFARYLGQLRDVLNAEKAHAETAARIEGVLRASVASMLAHGVGTDGYYRAEWHEGAKDTAEGFNAQVSALATLVAMLSNPER